MASRDDVNAAFEGVSMASMPPSDSREPTVEEVAELLVEEDLQRCILQRKSVDLRENLAGPGLPSTSVSPPEGVDPWYSASPHAPTVDRVSPDDRSARSTVSLPRELEDLWGERLAGYHGGDFRIAYPGDSMSITDFDGVGFLFLKYAFRVACVDLPFSRFVLSVLNLLNICPIQITCGAWGLLASFERGCMMRRWKPLARVFFTLYKPTTRKGFVYFVRATPHSPFYNLPSNPKAPRTEFFKVAPVRGKVPWWIRETDWRPMFSLKWSEPNLRPLPSDAQLCVYEKQVYEGLCGVSFSPQALGKVSS